MIHWFYGIFAISPSLQISQCENVWIILPLPFYVKSIFGILEVQNLPFVRFLLLSVFVISILSAEKNTSITILKDKLFVINHWKCADCK